MKLSSVSETKNHLSALLDQVRRGLSIVITDRGLPVARLVPPVAANSRDSGRLARLERAGLVRRGSGRRLATIANDDPPRTTQPVDLLRVLSEDREDRQ